MSSVLLLLLVHCTAGMHDIPALVTALHQHLRYSSLTAYHVQHPDLKEYLPLFKIMKLARVFVGMTSQQQQYNSPNTLHVIIPPYELNSNMLSSLFKDYCNVGTSWLIFIEVPIHELMKDSYIPVNCEVIAVRPDSTLTEVYHLENILHESTVGFWSETEGLQWTAGDFLQRRSDFKGIKIKVATVDNPPVTILEEENKVVTSVKGFFGDVWTTLEKRINFTSVYSLPSDGSWGAIKEDGSWTGMINMILKGEVDIAVSDFTITSIRTQVVDFSVPLIFTRFCVMTRQPDSSASNWMSFLAPFSTGLWLTVLLSIFLIALQLMVCYQRFNITSVSGFLDAVFQVFGMFCLQGQEETPQSLSGRILFIATHLTVMILPAVYSAALISFLAVQIVDLPFNTLQGLLEHRSYQLAVLTDSAPLNYFDSSRDTLMKKIYKNLIFPHLDKLPSTNYEGLLRICTQQDYAFMISLDIGIALVKDFPCTVIPVLGASIPDTLAFALPKKSPYREIINYNLQGMLKSGVMARLRINAWPGKIPKVKPLWTDVGLNTVMPVLGIVAAGIVMALVFLSFEYLIFKWYYISQMIGIIKIK